MRRAAALALLVLAATACGRYLTAAAAVVDGVTISRSDLEARVEVALGTQPAADRREVERETLVQMIQELFAEREARHQGITVSAADVEARISSVAREQGFPTTEEFERALRGQGLSAEELRQRVRSSLIVEAIRNRLRSQVRITEAQIRAEYGNGSQFEEVHARHILFSTQGTDEAAALKEARDALAQIRAGGDFAALARKLSDDPGTKDRGGDLGFVPRGRFLPEFERATFALKVGQVSEPVRTQVGYHLIQALERRSKTFEQTKSEIQSRLENEALQEAFRDFIAGRIKRSNIVVNPRYGDFDPETLRIVDHQFFVRSSPEPETEPAPGLQLPPQPAGG